MFTKKQAEAFLEFARAFSEHTLNGYPDRAKVYAELAVKFHPEFVNAMFKAAGKSNG